MFGEIRIFTTGENFTRIETIKKDSVQAFADFVRQQINNINNGIQANNSQDDIISKLERLAKLKEQKVLTEEEFKEQKSKILKS